MDSPYNLQTNSGKYKEVRYQATRNENIHIPFQDGISIKHLVCKIWGTVPDMIFAEGKFRTQTTVRQAYMYVMLKNTAYGLEEIGRMAQGSRSKPFDHTTVIHAKKTVNDLYETDKGFREKFDRLNEAIRTNKINFEK